VARRCVWSRNLENEEAKARYRAVKIQPQWVVTAGKQTNKQTSFLQRFFFITVPLCVLCKNLIRFLNPVVTVRATHTECRNRKVIINKTEEKQTPF
jgi:hypothetical protein